MIIQSSINREQVLVTTVEGQTCEGALIDTSEWEMNRRYFGKIEDEWSTVFFEPSNINGRQELGGRGGGWLSSRVSIKACSKRSVLLSLPCQAIREAFVN